MRLRAVLLRRAGGQVASHVQDATSEVDVLLTERKQLALPQPGERRPRRRRPRAARAPQPWRRRGPLFDIEHVKLVAAPDRDLPALSHALATIQPFRSARDRMPPSSVLTFWTALCASGFASNWSRNASIAAVEMSSTGVVPPSSRGGSSSRRTGSRGDRTACAAGPARGPQMFLARLRERDVRRRDVHQRVVPRRDGQDVAFPVEHLVTIFARRFSLS